MKKFKNFLESINILIGKKLVFFCYFVFVFSTLSAFLEVFSIGSIALFLGIILDPDKYLSSFLGYNIVNDFYSLEPTKRIIIGSIIMFMIFVFKNFLVFLTNYFTALLQYKIKTHLSKKLFKSYLHRDFLFHINTNPSTLWKNVIAETHYCTSYIILLSRLFGNLILIFGIFLLIFYYSTPYFSGIFLVLSLIVSFLYIYFRKKIKQKSDLRFLIEAKISQNINHALGSIKETILFKKQNWFSSVFNKDTELKEKQEFSMSIINSLPRIILEIFAVMLLLCIVVSFTFQDYLFSEMIPFLSLLALSMIRVIPVFNLISKNLNQIRFLNISKELIVKEFKYHEKIKLEKKSIKKTNDIKKFNKLEFNKVDFRYDKVKLIIKDFSFKINNKDKLLFVGPSGSGKTTIINLILGFLKPSKGKISVNKLNIFNDLDSWQSKISYIPQDIYLLDDTIQKNILFSSDHYNKRLLENVIKLSKLDKELSKFSRGLKTVVGHRGKKLSGGQKQRLAIARALYKEPEILVMDEPTSSLDESTEGQIIDDLFKNLKELTIIMVAHRVKKYKKKFNKIIKI